MVVIPQQYAEQVLAASQAIVKKEEEEMARIAAGHFLPDDLDQRLAAAGFRIIDEA